MLDAAAQRLVREGGRVVGVDVTTPDGTRRVLADAVVVATGGFSRNPELLARFAPQMEHALTRRRRGLPRRRTADGLAARRRRRGHAVHQGDLRASTRATPRRGRHRHPRGLQGRDRGQPTRASASSTSPATTRRSATHALAQPGRHDVPGVRRAGDGAEQRRGPDLRVRRARARRHAGPSPTPWPSSRRSCRFPKAHWSPPSRTTTPGSPRVARRRSAAATSPAPSGLRSPLEQPPFYAHPIGHRRARDVLRPHRRHPASGSSTSSVSRSNGSTRPARSSAASTAPAT